jgi:hypothetical protein
MATNNSTNFVDLTTVVTAAWLNDTDAAVWDGVLIPAAIISAGGTTGTGLKISRETNLGIFFGSGAPTLSAYKGSLYIRTDGTTTNNRMYINTDGSTTWTAVTTAA